MPIKKGQVLNPKGRTPGTKNKVTKEIKQLILNTIDELQKDPHANIATWAKEHPTDFWTKVATKIIPKDINLGGDGVTITIQAPELPRDKRSGTSKKIHSADDTKAIPPPSGSN